MFDLSPEILADIVQLESEGHTHSQIMRNIFLKHGEISPPIMAHYFKNIYGFEVSDFLPALGAWWPNNSDISDAEFDRRIRVALKK